MSDERPLRERVRSASAWASEVERAQLYVRLCGAVRVSLEYVVDQRAAIEHALDVLQWYAERAQQRGGEGSPQEKEALGAALARLAEVATNADTSGDRVAFLAMDAVRWLGAALNERTKDIAASRLRGCVEALVEAMSWPDETDAARESAEKRLSALLGV